MKNQKTVMIGGVFLLAAAVVTGIIITSSGEVVVVEETLTTTVTKAPEATVPAVDESPDSVVVRLGEVAPEEIAEARYLPDDAKIVDSGTGPNRDLPSYRQGNLKIRNVRALTNRERDGEFIQPKYSPDGLQILARRPGQQGLFLINALTGEAILLTDNPGSNANWSADGRVEVQEGDGQTRTYGADGTLDSVAPTNQVAKAFQENDAIMIKGENGATIPITVSDDSYFNPVLSPDGEFVTYQGLTSGLFIAPTDGSAPPRFIGPGNNPTWLPDSSGLVYDVTRDDGHHLIEGDLVLVDRDLTEQNLLTEGDGLISQMPSLGPNGEEVVFEVDGEIYVGDIN